MASVDAARDEFLRRHPRLELVADLSEHVDLIAEWIALHEDVASWCLNFARAFADLPPPPRISERLAPILRKSGHVALTALIDGAQSTFEQVAQRRLDAPPTFQVPPEVLRDPRLLLGVVALDFAHQQGEVLESIDLALLAVASGEEDPPKDRVGYDRVLDNWRKKLETIRILQVQLRRGFAGIPPKS